MICTSAADFAKLLPEGGRLMGLDIGSKTIGIAYCDASWSFASADMTLKRRKFTQDRDELAKRVSAQHIVGLVIGLPLNMDGSDSPQTQSVRAFARNIAALELPVLLWDERWSSMAVERAMIDADLSRGRRETRIDAAAAAWILQGAIDALCQQL